jgi:hypothetical protein
VLSDFATDLTTGRGNDPSRTSCDNKTIACCLQPHRTENFKLSTDPQFVEKVRDIVGLYMAPPERGMALCVNEKSQIQVLGRTQPLLPMRPGQIERRTHDYMCGTAASGGGETPNLAAPLQALAEGRI